VKVERVIEVKNWIFYMKKMTDKCRLRIKNLKNVLWKGSNPNNTKVNSTQDLIFLISYSNSKFWIFKKISFFYNIFQI
jgi:hypothetical protein